MCGTPVGSRQATDNCAWLTLDCLRCWHNGAMPRAPTRMDAAALTEFASACRCAGGGTDDDAPSVVHVDLRTRVGGELASLLPHMPFATEFFDENDGAPLRETLVETMHHAAQPLQDEHALRRRASLTTARLAATTPARLSPTLHRAATSSGRAVWGARLSTSEARGGPRPLARL